MDDVLISHKGLNKKVRLVCVLAIFPVVATAEVYEWADAQGRHHYSDRLQQDNARILPINPDATYYEVKKVYDGDTILLKNGQKVRLLGVNTPEVAGRNKNAEQGGEEAKAWLQQLLQHKKVRLEADVEKQDKYQRTLAYVFTEDKQHVNLQLVQQGLATVNIYPPNLKYVEQLLAAQQVAEEAGLGLWGNSAYVPEGFQTISQENYRGWKRITGRIKALKVTAKYSYLQFSDQVSLRIENQSLGLFPLLHDYVGKEVEVRGWINKNKHRFAVQVRHPGELKILRSAE